MTNGKGVPQQVAEELYEQIKEKKYGFGYRLPAERALVKEFGISRNSLREAIKILSTEGIVTVKQGSGIYVNDLRLKMASEFNSLKEQGLELNNIYEFRIIYEPEVARLAAKRATYEEVKEIFKCAEEISELVKHDLPFHEKDQEFHNLIAKASHNNVIKAISPMIMSFVIEGISISYASGGVDISKGNAVQGHMSIAKFIAAHDEIGAYSAMRMHINVNKEFIMEAFNL